MKIPCTVDGWKDGWVGGWMGKPGEGLLTAINKARYERN